MQTIIDKNLVPFITYLELLVLSDFWLLLSAYYVIRFLVDNVIFRKVDLGFMQKFHTIEVGLRAKCQIHSIVKMDQTRE